MSIIVLPLHVHDEIRFDSDIRDKAMGRLSDLATAQTDDPLAIVTSCWRPECASGQIIDTEAWPAVVLKDGDGLYMGDIHEMRDPVQDRVAGLALMLQFEDWHAENAVKCFYSPPSPVLARQVQQPNLEVHFTRYGMIVFPAELRHSLASIVSAPEHFSALAQWLGSNIHGFPYANAVEHAVAAESLCRYLTAYLTGKRAPLSPFPLPLNAPDIEVRASLCTS